MKLASPISLLSLFTLTGCAALINEQEEVASYREILDAGLPEPKPPSEGAPLTVKDSMILANQGNENLAIEGENYLRAFIEKRRSAAAFLPIISLTPSYTFEDNPRGGTESDLDIPLDASMLVNPISDAARMDLASANIEQRRAQLFDTQDSLLIDVARTHYEVIRAERATAVLENSLRLQEERVSDAQARLEAGIVRPLDVSQTKAQAAQTSVDLVVARNRVRTGRFLLGFLTASAISNRQLVDSLDQPELHESLEELLARAQTQRMDILAAEHGIEAASKRVQAAYGEYFPSIALDLQVFLKKQSDPQNLDWTSLIRISLPLFSAGLIEADVREALSLLRQSRLVDSLIRRTAQREVETAYDNFNTAAARVAQLQVQVKTASEALEQSESLYQVGLATNLERLTAQDALLSAKLQLVNAELDHKIFYLDLLRSTGSLHELLGLRRGEALRGEIHAEAR